jgi:PhzF family phenazine biosynthesis protein
MKKVYKMSAFSDGDKGGNPAGVMFNTDHLTESDMLSIAAEVGYSETAFVMQSNIADFKVRFFTPVDEVDLCGHATIATFNLMRDLNMITTGEYTQETKAGVLRVIVSESTVVMEQNNPRYFEEIPSEELLPCFQQNNFLTELPAMVVSTGLKDIMLPVSSLETLHLLTPDLDRISALSKKYNVTGIHAFCFETISDRDVHARNFAPLYGIDEESATGTSNGAMIGYIHKFCNEQFKTEMEIEQGHCMNLPSSIKVLTKIKDQTINSIYVGGSARRI